MQLIYLHSGVSRLPHEAHCPGSDTTEFFAWLVTQDRRVVDILVGQAINTELRQGYGGFLSEGAIEERHNEVH